MIKESLIAMTAFAALVLSMEGAYAQEKTVVYRYPGGVDIVSFDAAKVDIKDLNRWMQLSPTLSPYNDMLVPESLESCKAGDPRYRLCGAADSFQKNNALANLSDISQRADKLQEANYPLVLAPVVEYLRRIQQFSLIRGNRELDFLTNGNIESLEGQVDFVDPRVNCKTIIDNISEANDEKKKSELTRFDWANCVWFAERDHLGPYPTSAWKSFSAHYGITEKILEESPD
jgi:hypothetical protein